MCACVRWAVSFPASELLFGALSIDLLKTTSSPFYNGANPKNRRTYLALIITASVVLSILVAVVPETAGRSAFRVCYVQQHIKLGVQQVTNRVGKCTPLPPSTRTPLSLSANPQYHRVWYGLILSSTVSLSRYVRSGGEVHLLPVT